MRKKVILFFVVLVVIYQAYQQTRPELVIHNQSDYIMQLSYLHENKYQTEEEMEEEIYSSIKSRIYLDPSEYYKIRLSWEKDSEEILYTGMFFIKKNKDGHYEHAPENGATSSNLKIYRHLIDFCTLHVYIGNGGKIIAEEKKQGFCLKYQ